MAQPAAARRPAGPAAAGEPPNLGENYDWKQGLMQAGKSIAMMLAFQYGSKYVMKSLGLGQQTPDASLTPTGGAAVSSAAADVTGAASGVESAVTTAASAIATAAAKPSTATPAWDLGTPMTMLLFVSTESDPNTLDLRHPLVQWDDLTYGGWDDVREADLLLDVPETVRADNGSWWMDILLVKDGGGVEGKKFGEIANYRKELTRWMPQRRVRKEKRLLGKDEDEDEDDEQYNKTAPIVSYWSRNLTITVVSDGGQIDLTKVHPSAQTYYNLSPSVKNETLKYWPPIYPNDFWLLKENLMPINETTPVLPLRVTYQTLSTWKFQLFASLTVGFDEAAQQQGSGAELDEVKRMLTETNPILLITTAIVSVLHLVFEFLAFSSDVSHWRKKDKDENLVGVSLRTILTNCFVQLIILLYLHDSSEETSWMVLLTQGMGLLIEGWKITKVVDVRIRQAPGTLIGYRIAFEDKHELTEDEKKTQEYDALAFRIVAYISLPLLGGYTIYSLLYETHRGWYSFIITTLAQSVYMFGFIQLVPQLIINYKLKSVAHMPMKAMVFKTLSTVVDDFFAFCIKMPWLHRLACFRDDVVFVVLLYQRWIYRIDYSRVNEYGQVADDKLKADAVDAKDAKDAEKPESKKDK